MKLEVVYQRPKISQPGDGHKIYPYLLNGLKINRPNQVWATDLTYIPMARGFMYLIVIMDWHSRKVLSWRALDADFCIEAFEEALDHYGALAIFKSEQGCQFTSKAFTDVLSQRGVQISMDDKGCYRDNIFVEGFWRSMKYECVYLKAFSDAAHLKRELGDWFR